MELEIEIPKRRTFLNITPEMGDKMRAAAMVQHRKRWEATHARGTQICAKCRIEKNVETCFRRDPGYKSGRDGTCISCRNLNAKRNKRRRDARGKVEEVIEEAKKQVAVEAKLIIEEAEEEAAQEVVLLKEKNETAKQEIRKTAESNRAEAASFIIKRVIG